MHQSMSSPGGPLDSAVAPPRGPATLPLTTGQRVRPAVTARTLARARTGDARAIRYLWARYEPDIDRYVQSMIRDERDGERVRRELRLRLPRVIHTYEPREAPFPSWLLRVTREVAVEHLRRERSSCREAADTPLPMADVVVLRPAEPGSYGGGDAETRRSTASGRGRARS